MTSDKPKVLIQRDDMLYCEECREAWTIGNDEIHARSCPWYEHPPRTKIQMTMDEEIKEGIRNIGMGGHPSDAFRAPSHVPERIRKVNEDLARHVPVLPVVSAGVKGWVCARCQRVYAPHVSECPHCQPTPGVQHGS